MKKIVTLGEIMLRLSPKDYNRVPTADLFEAHYGGGEANVAIALSQFGIETSFITRLPQNELAEGAIKHLKSFGVDTKNITFGKGRMGIYFLEKGYSVRNSKVIYDREFSAFSFGEESDFSWDDIFYGKDIFHISGISFAINENTYRFSLQAMKEAKSRGLEISFDFNYRAKLWSLSEASQKIKTFIHMVDILFASHLDFINILGHDIPHPKGNLKTYYENIYKDLSKEYNFKCIVSSIRDIHSASQNGYGGVLYTGGIYQGKTYEIDIIDRVGTGDAFTGGFLGAYAKGKGPQFCIDFAVGSGALKHTITGDAICTSFYEIEEFISKDSFVINR